MTHNPAEALRECPFCAKPLRISAGPHNQYGRCETEDCWMNERKMTVPIDVPTQVEQWNRRAALTSPAPAGGDAVTAAVVVLAQANIPPDVQELLLNGDPARGIAPGALKKALAMSRPAPAPDVAGVVAAMREKRMRTFDGSYVQDDDCLRAATLLESLSAEKGRLAEAGTLAEMALEQIEAHVVIEVRNYEALFEAGKGEHGKPGYVTDATWSSWSGSLSFAKRALRYIRRARTATTQGINHERDT